MKCRKGCCLEEHRCYAGLPSSARMAVKLDLGAIASATWSGEQFSYQTIVNNLVRIIVTSETCPCAAIRQSIAVKRQLSTSRNADAAEALDPAFGAATFVSVQKLLSHTCLMHILTTRPPNFSTYTSAHPRNMRLHTTWTLQAQ